MLILSRKPGQKLIIADNIEITILETRGDSVKIGIAAPKDITVYRDELYQEILKENKNALAQTPLTMPSISLSKESAALKKQRRPLPLPDQD